MTEPQDRAVVRGHVWKKPSGLLLLDTIRESKGAVEAITKPFCSTEQIYEYGWTIVPVEIHELPKPETEDE